MNINPFDILKNAQKMQEQMGGFQDKLGDMRVCGSSGGGMVEIEMNGLMVMLAVRISPEAMEDREMLQDLVLAASCNCIEKVREAVTREMSSMTGLPPGFQIPGFPGGQSFTS